MSKLAPEVVSEVRKRFPEPAWSVVFALMETTPLPLLDSDKHELERNRVHMTAIKYSKGDIEQLKNAMNLASIDWRDLLVASGLGTADWQTVLRRAGFLVPRIHFVV